MRKGLFLIALLVTLICRAQKVQVNGIYYELEPIVKTATVTFEGRDDKGLYVNSYTGDIIIPSTIEEKGILYKVTNIGKGAFANTKTLRTVKLPSNLKYIEAEAFGNCEGLISIDIPMGVTNIGDLAFYKCRNLANVHFDDYMSHLYLGKGAFYGCSSLTKIELPQVSNQLIIHPMTFAECNQLTTFIARNRINVGEKAFQNCTSLQHAGIKEMRTIALNAFEGCIALDEEDRAELLKREEAAREKEKEIASDKNLDYIQDPQVKEIVEAYMLKKETSKTETKQRPFTADKIVEMGNISYAIDLRKKEAIVRSGRNASGAVEIPTYITYSDSLYLVKGIEKEAFKQNMKITSILLPDSLTNIGQMAFINCENLETVKLKTDKYVFIGKSSFEGCQSLSQVVLADSVEMIIISDRAFYGCSALASFTFPSIKSENFGPLPFDINSLAFAKCSSLSRINLNDYVGSVKEKAFMGCTNLKELIVGLGTTTIADDAFKDCKTLTKENLKAMQQRVKDNQALNSPAQFPSDVHAWVNKNIQYPKECQEQGIQGRAPVSFIIEEDGSITNIQILRAPHHRLAAEAARIVLSMPKWQPMKRAGKSYRMRMVLPIMFRLT